MNCSNACEQLSGWLDGQLPPAEAVALEEHLAACGECRSVADALRSQDADLKIAFTEHRQAAQRVAANAIQSLHESPAAQLPASRPWPQWGALLLAAAAGFLLAVVVFQPWKSRPAIVSGEPAVLPDRRQPEPPIARLVVATGAVDIRSRPREDWLTCADPAGFQCSAGSVVRTGKDVRCELQTADGCVIRLNHDTEITLMSPTAVEVQKGQIWCSSPESAGLKISAPLLGVAATQSTSPPWLMACPSKSTLITEVRNNGDVQVVASDGEAELRAGDISQRLARGESASIVNGQITKTRGGIDSILAAGWIHSLLVQKGRNNEELAGRIDQLLAQLGRSKLTFLYEQEIRALGEFAVLPLLRYVQSPMSANDPQRRHKAMEILNDIATASVLPDLINLLEDEDPQTRVLAAQALKRLTGLDQGRGAEQWREDANACRETIERWRQWWEKNSQQYPPPANSSAA